MTGQKKYRCLFCDNPRIDILITIKLKGLTGICDDCVEACATIVLAKRKELRRKEVKSG